MCKIHANDDDKNKLVKAISKATMTICNNLADIIDLKIENQDLNEKLKEKDNLIQSLREELDEKDDEKRILEKDLREKDEELNGAIQGRNIIRFFTAISTVFGAVSVGPEVLAGSIGYWVGEACDYVFHYKKKKDS